MAKVQPKDDTIYSDDWADDLADAWNAASREDVPNIDLELPPYLADPGGFESNWDAARNPNVPFPSIVNALVGGVGGDKQAEQLIAMRESMRDPSYAGSPEAWRAGLGNRVAYDPLYRGSPEAWRAGLGLRTGNDNTSEEPTVVRPLGPAGPRSPRMTVQDLLKANLNRLLGSQMQGFDEQRGLAAQLSDLREQGIAGQEQLAQDTAAGREGFLGELDISRAEQGEVERVQRETQKGFELARQQTQLDDALRASGVDKSAAGQRLQSMGIDPGNFADAAQSETTAMLYSQNMSSADVVNQMDMVAQASAQFASNANDQASAAAMFGIGEDLTFAMQAVDQARTQGQIDDAQALQAISDAERNAMQAYDSAITQLDVQTLQAAQAAAERAARAAEKSAAKNEKLAAAALGMQAIEKYRGGGTLTEQDYMNMSIAGMSSDLFDVGSGAFDATTDQALAAYASMLGMQDYESKLILDQEYGGGNDYIGITAAGYPMTFDDVIDAIAASPESFSGWEDQVKAASPAELEGFGYSGPAAP